MKKFLPAGIPIWIKKKLIKLAFHFLVVSLWLMPQYLNSYFFQCIVAHSKKTWDKDIFDDIKRTRLTQTLLMSQKSAPQLGGLHRPMMGKVKWRYLCWYLYIADDQPIWWAEWMTGDQVKAVPCERISLYPLPPNWKESSLKLVIRFLSPHFRTTANAGSIGIVPFCS